MTFADDARPPRRRPWGDARFLLGILLVVASIAGVWFVVSAARQTAPVLAAERVIAPGSVVTADDLREVEVSLGTAREAYVAPGELLPGAVATRTIDAGELVPSAALQTSEAQRTTTVVLRSSVDVPAAVGEGSVVEVWQAPLAEDGGFDAPRILVADATVVSVTRDESMMGGGAAMLEVVVSRSDVADVLTAIADESALSVIPTAVPR